MQQSFSFRLTPTPLRVTPPKHKVKPDVIKINVNPEPKDHLREHLQRAAKSRKR